MEVLLKIAQAIDKLNHYVGKLTGLLLIVMVAVGSLNVIASELGEQLSLQLTSNRYLELQWYLYGFVFLMGAAYTLQQDEHVRVDVFYGRWSPRRKAWANLLGSVAFLIPFCGLVLHTALPKVIRSWQRGEMSPDADGLMRAPIKTVVLLGFALLLLQGVAEAIKNAAILTGDRPLPGPDRATAQPDPPDPLNQPSQEDP